MSCCCQAGTGTVECCCQQSAERYIVTFAGISNPAGTGTGTGTGTTGDDTVGCFLVNRSFCLCYGNCGNYFSDPFVFYEGNALLPCARRFSTFRIQLMFECGLAIGTGAGTGTDATAPSGSVVVRVYGLCPNTDGVTTIGGVLLATYSVGRKSYHCETTTRTLSLVSSDSSYCVGWPSTLTLTADNGTLLCQCNCGPGVVDIGSTIVYDVRIGPPTNDDCPAGDCGCSTPAIRICMKKVEACYWRGAWGQEGGGIPFPVYYIDGTTGWTYYPFSCLIADQNGPWLFLNGQINPQTEDLKYAHMYYYPATDKVYFGWKTVGNLNSPDGVNITGNNDLWLVRYSISATSFLVYGSNIFTLEYQDLTQLNCVLPSTITVDYYQSDNSYCDTTFRCDICTPGKSLPGGWAMTISGVSGATDTVSLSNNVINPATGLPLGNLGGCMVDCECSAVPCESVNGDYCLGNFNIGGDTCAWDSAYYGVAGTGSIDAFGPIAAYYTQTAGLPDTWQGTPCRWLADAFGNYVGLITFSHATMGIYGGVIWVQLEVTTRVIYATTPFPQTITYPLELYHYWNGNYQDYECRNKWFYTIGIDSFDCEGSNTLNLQCSTTMKDPGVTVIDACDCSMPASITISPTTECGVAVTPPEVCPCATPTAVNPLVRVRGITNGTCLDCKCQEDLDICFSGGSSCVWNASFTVSDSIGTCDTGATQAVLRWDAATTSMILLIQDSGGSTIIEYFVDTSAGTGTGVGFTCPGGPYSMSQTGPTPSPECGWPVTVDLYMDSICDDCNPCTPSTMVSSFPCGMNFTFTFASITYSLCCYQNSACTLVSAAVSTGTGSSGGSLYAVVDFGANPKIYARVYIYFDPTGAGTGNTLIGVYAFLLDIDTFSCGTSNSMSLVAGNYPECGWEIATYPYTGWLSSTGTLRGDTCYTCDGSAMPSSLTVTMTADADRGCECFAGPSTSLVFNCVTQRWEGSLTCNHAYGGSTTITISVRQSGTKAVDLRMTSAYADTCSSDTSDAPPATFSTPACGSVLFKDNNTHPRYVFTVTW